MGVREKGLPDNEAEQAEGFSEASTVEALAVMIHLAVMSFDLASNVKLGPCKDVSALYKGVCDPEEKFIPIAAIAAGLFGVNIQINAMGCAYHIINSHYGHVWPSGALEYKDRTGWCLTNLPFGCVIKKPVPEPKREQHCYHRGTYRAYTRLNSLRVIEVASDGYCGFHAVSTLLDGTSAKAGFERRRRLSEITAAFVSANLRHRSDIETYLKVNNQVKCSGAHTIPNDHGAMA